MITLKCKLVAIQSSQYTNIVVEDLNREATDDLKYLTVVLLPNWNYSEPLHLNDVGYLQFESVEAGKTQWFNREKGDFECYKYNSNYFINFIKIKDIENMKEFRF